MMDIKILTFSSAYNYGAVLQAYALKRYLSNDNNVEFLNIEFNSNKEKTSVKNVLRKDTYLKKIFRKIKKGKFKEFQHRYLKICDEKYKGDIETSKIPDEYDLVIVGSDQVWNTDITNKTEAFFLNFVEPSKRVAYAGSFGRIPNELEVQWAKKYFSSYKNISVREQDAKDFLKEKCNIDAMLVCDPVFLLDKNEWSEVINSKTSLPKYIFVYYMEVSEELIENIKELQQVYKYKVVALQGGLEELPHMKKVTNLRGVGPIEFLQYIYHAEIVMTNSFHALAFSYIFERKLIVLSHSKWNSRIDSLLSTTNQKHKICYRNEKVHILDFIIDGKLAYAEMDKLITDSKLFLDNIVM